MVRRMTSMTWVGPDGRVVGTDIDPAMLAAAQRLVTDEGLGNVTLVHDDLFASQLEPAWFDLVHARFQLAPLGRGQQQMASYLRLVRPGGTIVLEEVDPASWHFIPPAPAFDRLKPLVGEAFRMAGGDPDAAATQLELSAAPASRSTPAPRSRHCPRATPTCGCRWSISPPCKGCCGRSWTPRSSSGSSGRPSGSSRTPAAVGSRSPSSSAGACVGPRMLGHDREPGLTREVP